MDGIDISRASELYRSKDYAGFMKYGLSFDKIEDGDTLDRMGICYRDGQGVTKNIEKAIECFEKAVDNGYFYSAFRLGLLYDNAQDFEKAICWYRISAEHNETSAMYNLARIYRKEKSVRDINKAIGWYEKAAEKGHIKSMYDLGYTYKSEVEPADIELSTMWYEEAANHGDTDALVSLGNTYKRIKEVKDYTKALHYYKLAADKGNIDGKYNYAKLALQEKITDDVVFQYLFESAVSGEPDMEDAISLLKDKAESGSSVAQFYLGRYYTEKTDIENHEQTAYEWYKKSAMQGYVPAQNLILINQAENTNQTVKEIKDDTSTIVETTAENSRKLDAITNTLMSMNEKIANIRATSFTGNADTEDDEIGSALEKSAAVINSTVHDSPADKLNKHTEHLIYLFGEQTWERLLPETQKSLISSAYLLKECEGMPPDFDYSGICITAVVALEKELRRVFSDNYIEYLRETRDEDRIPDLFKNDNYFFSLGKLAQIFGYNTKTEELRYDFYARAMEEYLKTIVKKVYSYNPLAAFIEKDDPQCFIMRCLTINKSYRCKAAHCGNVSYDDAVDCCYEVYGESSAHIDAKRQSAEIISLLRDLYSKLK